MIPLANFSRLIFIEAQPWPVGKGDFAPTEPSSGDLLTLKCPWKCLETPWKCTGNKEQNGKWLFLGGSRSPRIYLSKCSQMMCFFQLRILTAIHSTSFTMAFPCQPTRPSWSQHLHEAQGSSIRRREMCDIQHLNVAISAEVDQLRAEMSRQHQNGKKTSNWKYTPTLIHFPCSSSCRSDFPWFRSPQASWKVAHHRLERMLFGPSSARGPGMRMLALGV